MDTLVFIIHEYLYKIYDTKNKTLTVQISFTNWGNVVHTGYSLILYTVISQVLVMNFWITENHKFNCLGFTTSYHWQSNRKNLTVKCTRCMTERISVQMHRNFPQQSFLEGKGHLKYLDLHLEEEALTHGSSWVGDAVTLSNRQTNYVSSVSLGRFHTSLVSCSCVVIYGLSKFSWSGTGNLNTYF